MWVFQGRSAEKPVILFRYSETRSGEVPREILKGFHGYLQMDDFSAYEALEGEMRRVGCFSPLFPRYETYLAGEPVNHPFQSRNTGGCRQFSP